MERRSQATALLDNSEVESLTQGGAVCYPLSDTFSPKYPHSNPGPHTCNFYTHLIIYNHFSNLTMITFVMSLPDFRLPNASSLVVIRYDDSEVVAFHGCLSKQ